MWYTINAAISGFLSLLCVAAALGTSILTALALVMALFDALDGPGN